MINRSLSLRRAAVLSILVACFIASAHAATPEPTPVTPALIEAAKKEGKVVFYSSTDLLVLQRVAKAFEAKSPEINVQVERSGAERIFQRIGQEYAAKVHT